MTAQVFYVKAHELPDELKEMLFDALNKSAEAAKEKQYGMVIYQVFSNGTDTLKFQGGFIEHEYAKKLILEFNGQEYLDSEIKKLDGTVIKNSNSKNDLEAISGAGDS